MAKLKQGLQLRQQQRLSPQQVQIIRMLEINTLQMEERIVTELEMNPTLEEDRGGESSVDMEGRDAQETESEKDSESTTEEEFSIEDLMPDSDDYQDGDYRENFGSSQEDSDWQYEILTGPQADFRQSLLDQLRYQTLHPNKQAVAEYIVGNLDNNGYLTRSAEAISDDLLLTTGYHIPEENVEETIELVQSLEPAGIAARSLAECIALQLRRHRDPLAPLALSIIERSFDDFSNRRFKKLMRRHDVDDLTLQAVYALVQTLNPKPGGGEGGSDTARNLVIIPDFILNVDPESGELSITLHGSNTPELRVSRNYRRILRNLETKSSEGSSEDQEAARFVMQKISSAKWFIDALRQRNRTLLLVMEAIVEAQKEYFMEGDPSLVKPLTLKDIAQVVGVDISTVSRVAKNKYVQTPFGIKPLSDFFSLTATQVEGEDVSAREVKAALKEIIDNEDKQNPLTDEQLNDEMRRRGYEIARRTIAKYRMQLDIPVARLRKRLS